MQAAQQAHFVRWFRAAAPYIHAFGGRTFVIAFGGEVVAEGSFVSLTHDLNLLASLGVRLVLVHGARPQIEAQLKAAGRKPQYVNGIRVTDEEALSAVKQASGQLRVEIEALLSMGLPNSPMANADIRVASGNFVTARPRGVVDGVDMCYTGEVRKVDADAINTRLDDGELVLLSPLGYSPTGEIFNVTLEDVAAQTAIALGAEKLVFLMNEPGLKSKSGRLLRELTVSDAEKLLRKGQSLSDDASLYLPHVINACKGGTVRAHLISRHVDGALLLELFTHDGVGSMITRDPLEQLRDATIKDVGGILRLIEPLEADGTLVKRSRELLEMEIARFSLLEHDKVIVGCAALYPFPEEKSAEFACLAVAPEYRDASYGERLLKACEERAKGLKLRRLFALTTHAAHWFLEQGFRAGEPAALPSQRQALYNWRRNSKVFLKRI
jgi:amino-acid N-acetyltransferase